MTLPQSLLSALAHLTADLPRNGAAALVRTLNDAVPQMHEAVVRQRAGLTLHQQAAIDNLMREWRGSFPSVSGAELAVALNAMCAYDVHIRRELQVEAVWTGPRERSSGLRRTEQVILEMIGEAQQSIWLVAFAAYRVPAIAQALGDAMARGVRLRCVVEDHEISGGKVSFDPLPALIAPGLTNAEAYIWPLNRRPVDGRGRHGTLHAKALVVDERIAFVTSANLTEDALNLNMELGVALRIPSAAKVIAVQLEAMISRGDLVARG